MSNHLSPSTKALLAAAKQDRPSRETRAAMWTGVTSGLVTHTPLAINVQSASASGASAPGASVPGAAPPPPPSAPIAAAKGGGLLAGASMKGAFIGALFGSAISIGVATFMLRSKPADAPPPVQTVVVTAPEKANVPAPLPNAAATNGAGNGVSATDSKTAATSSFELGATSATTPNVQVTGNGSSAAASGGGSTSSKIASGHPHRDSSVVTSSKTAPLSPEELDGMLARETALVAEARRELLVGDPAAALKSVRIARSLEARQFEPEEMSLEARALRQLGRDAEAAKVENQLRTSYPDTNLR